MTAAVDMTEEENNDHFNFVTRLDFEFERRVFGRWQRFSKTDLPMS